MVKLNSYLNFSGQCYEAFSFYKQIFGGEFGMVVFEDEEADDKQVMYISLPIGADTLMGSDCAETLVQGNNHDIFITTDTQEEADQLFIRLSDKGSIRLPIGEQPFGYVGALTDQFGIHWTIEWLKS